MLKSIRLQNFFSFKDTTIQLNQGVNILIGINGSGKSNLIRALKLLRDGVGNRGFRNLIVDNWGGFDAVFNFSKSNQDRYINLRFEFDGDFLRRYGLPSKVKSVFYEVTIKQLPDFNNYYLNEYIYSSTGYHYARLEEGEAELSDEFATEPVLLKMNSQESILNSIADPSRYYTFEVLKKAILEVVVYDDFDTTRYSNIRRSVNPTSEKRLLSNGGNLTQMLNTIKINDKSDFELITKSLKTINPHFGSLDFNFLGGNIELVLEEENLKRGIHISKISDGTLHFLILLSIIYNKNRGGLICIDEPETGLHPDMIHTVCEAIKEVSAQTQFILATHSESILNNFKLEDIKVFEKDKDNSTIVNSLTKEQFEGWYDEFFPGNMWRDGDLGGNRW